MNFMDWIEYKLFQDIIAENNDEEDYIDEEYYYDYEGEE